MRPTTADLQIRAIKIITSDPAPTEEQRKTRRIGLAQIIDEIIASQNITTADKIGNPKPYLSPRKRKKRRGTR